MSSRAVISIGTASIVVAACFADLGGFSGGADDAGVDAVDAPPFEHPPPVHPPDPIGDAGIDAPPPLCDPSADHVICDDFDTNADGGWEGDDLQEGGLMGRDLMVFTSPPAALKATIPALGSDREAWALRYVTLPKPPFTLRAALSVSACPPGDSFITFASVQNFLPDAGYAHIDVGVQGETDGGAYTYVSIDDGTTSTTTHAGDHVSFGAFSRVELEVKLDPTVGSVVLRVDGVVRASLTPFSTDSPVPSKRRAFWVGAYGYQSPACVVRVDDVVVDLGP